MNIGIMCGSAYPITSSTGNCALQIAKELAKKHTVTVIGRTSGAARESYIVYDAIKVYNVCDREARERGAVKGSRGKSFLVKAKWIAKFILQRASVRWWLADEYSAALEDLGPFDVVIAVRMPVEAVIAVCKYKERHPSSICLYYLFDEFVDSLGAHYFRINRWIKHEKNQEIERATLEAADGVVYVHQNYNYLRNTYPGLMGKMIEVEHPLVTTDTARDTTGPIDTSDVLKLTFGGSLSKGRIDPGYFLRLLDYCKNTKFVCNFYTDQNACNCFSRINKNPDVHFWGWIERQELLNEWNASDVLISIAIKDGHQISSKLFEYMSIGKPIVHIYSTDTDSNLRYLARYPLALCLDDRVSVKENAMVLEEWLEKNRGKRVELQEVLNLFYDCTPMYIAKVIESFWDKEDNSSSNCEV